MKNIKKIIREEIEDFKWLEELPEYDFGDSFTEEDVCYYEKTRWCEVLVTDDEIIFDLKWEDFLRYTGLEYDEINVFYPRMILYHGGTYDGDGNSYEFDPSEFNYFNHFRPKQINEINKLLTSIGLDVDIEDFIDGEMWSLMSELKYPPIQSYFDDLGHYYLSTIGYTMEKNKWISLSNEFKHLVDKTGSEWFMPNHNQIQITVPMERYFSLRLDGKVKTISDLLYFVSDILFGVSWDEYYHDLYDVSGAEDEIQDHINTFIEKLREFTEDYDEIEEYDEVLGTVGELGFTLYDNTIGQYIKENENDTYWWLKVNFNKNTCLLKLFKSSASVWWGDSLREFSIPINKLSDYVNNYSLKLESTKK